MESVVGDHIFILDIALEHGLWAQRNLIFYLYLFRWIQASKCTLNSQQSTSWYSRYGFETRSQSGQKSNGSRRFYQHIKWVIYVSVMRTDIFGI